MLVTAIEGAIPMGSSISKIDQELDQELDALLTESIEDAQLREAKTFDHLARNAEDLVLYGAGNLGRRTLTGLREVGIEPVAFVDNNPKRWGENCDGIPVLSPEEGAKRYGIRATFVITIWRSGAAERMQAHIDQLRELGCKSVPFLPLYWKFPNSLLPHYTLDLPHHVHLQSDRVRQGFALMADEVSRREYLAQLRFRLLGDFACFPSPVPGDIYFGEELFDLGKEEILVDCGAFDGDTLSLFLDKTRNSFNSIIAFEPEPANYRKLAQRVDLMPPEVRRRIALHQSATGESNKTVHMGVGIGPSSHIGKGDHPVKCATLDSMLHDVAVSFIKMDIEGSELATLAGAQQSIRKHSPILAISAYHRQDDLWNIPLFIHGLNPDYSFYLRPHLLEGWDLVCYAIPSNRRR